MKSSLQQKKSTQQKKKKNFTKKPKLTLHFWNQLQQIKISTWSILNYLNFNNKIKWNETIVVNPPEATRKTNEQVIKENEYMDEMEDMDGLL